jgi:hypothetical protein
MDLLVAERKTLLTCPYEVVAHLLPDAGFRTYLCQIPGVFVAAASGLPVQIFALASPTKSAFSCLAQGLCPLSL